MDEFDDDTLTSQEIDILIGASDLVLVDDAKLKEMLDDNETLIDKVVEWGTERFITQQPHDTNGFISNIVEELAELKEATSEGDWDGQVDAINDIMVFCITEIPKLGIDPNISLKECLQEISSRRGAWNDELQKWKKDTSDEAKALWYKADYSKYKGKS